MSQTTAGLKDFQNKMTRWVFNSNIQLILSRFKRCKTVPIIYTTTTRTNTIKKIIFMFFQWREGRSQCERPRTYDKFYQKTPGNFQALVGKLKIPIAVFVLFVLSHFLDQPPSIFTFN